MSYKILACPFCGAAPVTFGSGEGQKGLMIECVESGCVNPHTSYYNRHKAVEVWNARAGKVPNIVVTDAEINGTSPL